MRIRKTTPAATTRYVYDDQSVLLQTDADGNTLAKYTYGSNHLFSLTHHSQPPQFYLFDALGSVVALAKLNGALQARYDYDAWGNPRPNAAGDSANIFGFTGHEKDDESGLYYFKARFYDPDIGQFLSQDAFEGMADTPPSLHQYLYAYANPTVFVDLDGHKVYKYKDENGKMVFSDKARPNTSEENARPTLYEHPGAESPSALNDRTRAEQTEIDNSAGEKATAEQVTESKKAPDSQPCSGDVECQYKEDRSNQASGYEKFAQGTRQAADLANDFAMEAVADGVIISAAGLAARGVFVTAEQATKIFGKGGKVDVKQLEKYGVQCCCFAEGTPILAEHGMVPIEQIKVGDWVYSRNPETGETALKPVTELFINEQKPLYELILKDSADQQETIRVTDNHPYWVMGKGWIESSQLECGMLVGSYQQKELSVVSSKPLGTIEKTYNFSVDGFHTYFVGKQGAFVHNNQGCKQCGVADNLGIADNLLANLTLSERHILGRLSIPKKAGNTLFLGSKQDALADIAEIQAGKAIREGNLFTTSSGRVWGIHNSSIHPVSGPSTVDVTSAEYKILVQAQKQGSDKAMLTLEHLTKKQILSSEQYQRTKEIIDMIKKLKND